MFKSAGLVARYDKRSAIKLAEELSEYLANKGLDVYVEETLKGKIITQGKFISLETMKTDFIITIGGDGTILRTCIAAPKPEPPILAINMGVRGFLTEVEPKDAYVAVEKCLRGEYKIEKCFKLAVSTGETPTPDALNDVVISTGEPAKILYMKIFKDDKPILKCQADGLILSTQTGSTGYSLSAGGPVLDKAVDAFVLTPICSLTVFRSIVFPAEAKVTVKVIRPQKVLILIDGNYRRLVAEEEPTLTVTRSENMSSFIRFKEDFYSRLRDRLLFKGMG
ncbi:MAG: NAD(+)/NADH kinase [Candidatus Bathyarchaeales archaeon]